MDVPRYPSLTAALKRRIHAGQGSDIETRADGDPGGTVVFWRVNSSLGSGNTAGGMTSPAGRKSEPGRATPPDKGVDNIRAPQAGMRNLRMREGSSRVLARLPGLAARASCLRTAVRAEQAVDQDAGIPAAQERPAAHEPFLPEPQAFESFLLGDIGVIGEGLSDAGRETAGLPGGDADDRAVTAHDRDGRRVVGDVGVALPSSAARSRIGEPRPLKLAEHIRVLAQPVKERKIVLSEGPQADRIRGIVCGHGRRYQFRLPRPPAR
jgi:hypothetical protein